MILFYWIANLLSRGITSGPRWPLIIYLGSIMFLTLWSFLFGLTWKKKGMHLLRDVECLPASLLLLTTPLALLQMTGYIDWAPWAAMLESAMEVFAFVRLFRANEVKNPVSSVMARFVAHQVVGAVVSLLVVIICDSVFHDNLFWQVLLALLLWYGFADLWKSHRMRCRLRAEGVRIVTRKRMVAVFVAAMPALAAYFFGGAFQLPWLQYAGVVIGIAGVGLTLFWTVKGAAKFGRMFFHVILIRLVIFATAVFAALILVFLAGMLVVDRSFREEMILGVANLWILVAVASILAVSVFIATLLNEDDDVKAAVLEAQALSLNLEGARSDNSLVRAQKYTEAQEYQDLADNIRNRQ